MFVLAGSLRSGLLVFCLFLISLTGAQLAEASSPLAALELRQDLEKRSSALGKKIRIYHYFWIPEKYPSLSNPLGRQDFLARYFRSVTANYWNLNYTAKSYVNAGAGLYSAIDPQISRQFGNSVLEIQVPAHFRRLNLVKWVPLRAQTVRSLVDEGLLDWKHVAKLFEKKNERFYFTRDTMKFGLLPEHREFRALVQDVLEDLNIEIIEYNWNTKLAGFCKGHSYSSFVLTGQRQPSRFEALNENNDLDHSKGKVEFFDHHQESRQLLRALGDHSLPLQSSDDIPSASQLEDQNIQMNLVSDFEFENLSPSESVTIDRLTRFRTILETASTKKPPLGAKAIQKFILELFPNFQERKELFESIYSCVPYENFSDRSLK